MDIELLDYKDNKNSVSLVLKYHHLIHNLSLLCKGTYREPDALFRWFYGLFLGTQPRTIMNILEARDRVRMATQFMTREDCYNQILIFFLILADGHKPKLGTFNHYIRMVLGWRTKNWMDGVIRRAEVPLPVYSDEECMDEDIVQPFTLNLSWVMHGSSNPLFVGLKAYERYILFLYFTEGMSLVKIAHTTYQSKNTVNGDLHRILEKCRVAIRE